MRKLSQKIINKDKWWDMLSRFIDVLRINIFIVDYEGRVVLPPEEGKYGGGLLADKRLGFDLIHDSFEFHETFVAHGQFYESVNRYELHSYAIPIKVDDTQEQTVAYMIVGPVILNKRMESARYKEYAAEYEVDEADLVDEISELRVVSNLMMNSILNLLSEIIKDNVELTMRQDEIEKGDRSPDSLSTSMKEVAQEIYSTVRIDELLATLLDVALKMTETECGSIMVVDEANGDLTIKVSRGLKMDAQDSRLKMGEGIAGLAAKEKAHFFIEGNESDNRIIHLLRRPEIKHALVMPLISKNRVFGVLNLHTKREMSKIRDNFDNLQYLSKLLSSAF